MRALVFLLVASLVFVTAPVAQAQTTVSATIVALGGEDCGDDPFCFEVESGDLSDLGPGATLELTFRNDDVIEHEIAMADLADADTDDRRDTSEEDAIGQTDRTPPGETRTVSWEVPSDVTEGVYFWCDLPGHEDGGMWIEVAFTADGGDGGTGGTDGGTGDGDQQQQPFPTALGLLALLGVALVARRRV